MNHAEIVNIALRRTNANEIVRQTMPGIEPRVVGPYVSAYSSPEFGESVVVFIDVTLKADENAEKAELVTIWAEPGWVQNRVGDFAVHKSTVEMLRPNHLAKLLRIQLFGALHAMTEFPRNVVLGEKDGPPPCLRGRLSSDRVGSEAVTAS